MKHTIKFLFLFLILLSLLIITACDVTSSDDKIDPLNDTNYDTTSALDTLDPIAMTDDQIDSLFKVLVGRTLLFEDVNSIEDAAALNFKELSDAFGSAVKADSMHAKANVGFIIASVLSLNSNSAILKIADSLDAYISDWDNYSDSEGTIVINRGPQYGSSIFKRIFARKKKTRFIRRSYESGGINGMSAALLSRLPEITLRQADVPTFPTFITLSYIQDLIEVSVIPILSDVIRAFARLEAQPSVVVFEVEGDTVELDKSDFYIVDAGITLLRSTLSIFTAYNWDVYASATDQSYSWVDKYADIMLNPESFVQTTLILENDTLTENCYSKNLNGKEDFGFMYDLISYNYMRDDFLKIQRNNHKRAHDDLLNSIDKLQSAVQELKNEVDDQGNDLIKKVDFDSFENEFVDVESIFIDEGFSSDFASNFKSPTTLLNFLENLMTGPYAISETIEGVNFNFTVNFSAAFTNPVEDFKAFYPKHRLRSKADIFKVDTLFEYVNEDSNSEIYLSSSVDTFIIDILESDIESVNNEYIYLKEPYAFEKFSYSFDTYQPFDLVDDQGNKISYDFKSFEEAFDNMVFPYWDDYTFGGIFPDMSRSKWVSLLDDILEVAKSELDSNITN